MSIEPNLENISLDIEAAKQAMLSMQNNMTDISDHILDSVVTPTHFETAEYTEVKNEVQQMYLIDISNCAVITEAWINGLKSLLLCTSLDQYDADKANEGRFEHGLPDVIPDTALSLKIKTFGETKVVFIGYMDSCQAYLLLANYIASVKDAKLYLDNNGVLKEVKTTNIEGMRIHV